MDFDHLDREGYIRPEADLANLQPARPERPVSRPAETDRAAHAAADHVA
jgi:hypothetical protein